MPAADVEPNRDVLEVGMKARATHRRRVVTMLSLIAVAFGSAAACTNDGPDSPGPSLAPTSASPTPSVDPSIAGAEQQARAAYAGYIQTWALASQAADPDNPELARYVADPLLSLTRHNIRTLKDIGAVQVGAQTATVQRVEVDLAGKPPTVTIYSCLDYTNRKLVYKSNQSEVPNSGPGTPKVAAVSKVALYNSGQWLVNEVKQGSHPC
jgi:hypothetical protein